MKLKQIIKRLFVFLFSSVLLVNTNFASANSAVNEDSGLPLWEVGLGAGVIHQLYYTGTKQTRVFAFPTVFPVYRGKIFKSDDEGIRAQLFKNDRLKLDMSADFNLAIDSDDIDLREGMDDIENVFQVGPSFELLLNENKDSRLYLNLPIRAVLEVGGGEVESTGFNISPILFYQKDLNLMNSKWIGGASIGPQFGTSEYHNIYYGVEDEFETADRSVFSPSSGYSGSRLQLTLKSRNKKRFILWFLRYENIDGASFDSSPLVETDHNLTVGFLYSYNFLKSKKLVE